MLRALPVLVGCAVLAVACGGSPTRPTDGGRTARLSRTRFVAFGDSLTSGEVTAPVSAGTITKQVVVPAAAYPSQLQSMLAARFVSQASSINVANAGLGGETVIAGVVRFEDVLATMSSDVVLIWEGVNGLGAIGPEVSTVLVRDMVRSAKARGERVFVASMIPTIVNRQRSQVPSQLEAYNARLRQMTVEEGAVFVDLYTTLLPDALSVIGVDGLHPTEAGYRRIAEVFFNAIVAELSE